MPLISSELTSGSMNTLAVGPRAVADLANPPEGSPLVQLAGPLLGTGTIAASSNFTSAVIPADGFDTISAAITSSQAGTMTIQRYFDPAGTIVQGSALSASLTAATPAVINNTDNLIFRSFVIEVTNSSGSTAATITKFALLLMA